MRGEVSVRAEGLHPDLLAALTFAATLLLFVGVPVAIGLLVTGIPC